MCLFLSPKFIDFLRHREFGQNIREEGPEGHQTKAGTPTMGGIIIFLAIAIPYLLLSTARLAVAGRVRRRDRRARCWASPTTTRRSSSAARSGCAARTKLVVTVAISLGLWWIATHKANIAPTVAAALRATSRRPRARCSRCSSTSWSPGRRRRSTSPTASTASPPDAPRSSCWRTSGSRSSPGAARSRRCWPAAWSGRASAFCGSTASRRASSWATPVRWGSAGRSPAWRS